MLHNRLIFFLVDRLTDDADLLARSFQNRPFFVPPLGFLSSNQYELTEKISYAK